MSQTDENIEDIPTDTSNVEEYDEEIGEETVEEEEEIYLSEDLISGPIQNDESTIPINILEFDFSYGYDCRKYFNIALLDDHSIVFGSGNFIHFLDANTRKMTFRRSALGGGIGHVRANPHPDYPHFAVAENGDIPFIIIYEWPNLDVVCVLKGGAAKIYSNIDYNPSGEMLASQSGDPDYLITIWDWPKHRILLRTKSYSNDVNRVKFSPYVPGQLTTCGIAHIKFWKMANTFTGLKLKGELGRFGKTEYSDILGILPMPDEKVLSGCSWGNILVWDGGLIKLEVFRTGRKKCHEAPIVQFYFVDGELWTIGMDGHVKVWWYEKIDQADPPDDDRIIQIEPTYDYFVDDMMLMNLRKILPSPEDFTYFGQDGNGGLWKLDFNPEEEQKIPQQIFKCHGGRVDDMATCPWGYYLATVGEGKKLFIYNYVERQLIFEHKFPANGRCILWLPLQIQATGDELIIAFDDGTLRVCIVSLNENPEEIRLNLLQIYKPHNKPINKILINSTGRVLVSGGEDKIIFLFKISHDTLSDYQCLEPIGYVPMPNPITYLLFHPEKPSELYIGCLRGEFLQFNVLEEPVDYTEITYILDITPNERKFVTYKAQIRRDIKISEIEARKAAKLEKKMKELEDIKKENPGLEIDEDVFLADSESEEELEPLHIPEIPNRILWMQITENDTIWLSMGGYDAGYIYEYTMDQKDDIPLRFQMIHDADDVEISSFLYNYNKKYLIFAMQDGVIRINKVDPDDFRNLKNYWKLSLHDNLNGFIPKMCFSYDEKYFFTCGHDGNILSHRFYPEDNDYIPSNILPEIRKRQLIPTSIEDDEYYTKLSLEDAIVKKEKDRVDRLANAHKKDLREKLKILSERFFFLLEKNDKLLPTQIIPRNQLELDPRITSHIDDVLNKRLELVKRKLAYDLEKAKTAMKKLFEYFLDSLDFIPLTIEGLNEKVNVRTSRQKKIPGEHENMMVIVEAKIAEAAIKSRAPERAPPPSKPKPKEEEKDERLEYFLMTLSPSVIRDKLGPKLMRLLGKHRKRKSKWEKRKKEWINFLENKPKDGINLPEDEIALEIAKQTIGDYKLKSSSDYKAPKELQETTYKKYKQLLNIRKKQYKLRYEFNKKVYELREAKMIIRNELLLLQTNLLEIHQEMPEDKIKFGPQVPDMDPNEFPENNLAINVILKDGNEINIEPKIIIEEPNYNRLERYILGDKSVKKLKTKTTHLSTFEELMKANDNDDNDSPWESEMRRLRFIRKLYEQDEIIKLMNEQATNFNQKVSKMKEEQQKLEIDTCFIDLHVLTLHQELLILKQFESVEDKLQEVVNHKIKLVMDMEDETHKVFYKIAEINDQINKMHEDEKIISLNFHALIKDNKFSDFLVKVFKKKYKPVKIRNPDESSSESSSSSDESDEDDTGSIDSRDFRILKQDLNVCPKGCDLTIFNSTIQLRSSRHQIEQSIKDKLKEIEYHKKEMEIIEKKIRDLKKSFQESQNSLEKFQKEKQRKLNEIRCVVILKFHQIQNFKSPNEMSLIPDSLIFSKNVLSKLYRRVEELQGETIEQRAKHRLNVTHLMRMNTDCNFMIKKIHDLKQKITDAMLIKFGRVINLQQVEEEMLLKSLGKDDVNELEEILIKKLVYDLRMTLMDIKSMYQNELRLWRGRIEQAETELARTIRDNTSRHELLAVLKKEKTYLFHVAAQQDKKKAQINSMNKSLERYENELEKLEDIADEQYEQIQKLKDEILILKTKGMNPKLPKHKKRKRPRKLQKSEIQSVEESGLEEEEEEEIEITQIEYEEKIGEEEIAEYFFPTLNSEKIVQELLKEMLDNLNMVITTRSLENFARGIVYSVFARAEIEEIIDDLISNLPLKLSKETLKVVEDTAEKLMNLREDTSLEDDATNVYAKDIVENIINQTFEQSTSTIIGDIIYDLIDQLPLEVIKENIHVLVHKAQDSATLNLCISDSTESLNDLTVENRDKVIEILEMILEKIPYSPDDQ